MNMAKPADFGTQKLIYLELNNMKKFICEYYCTAITYKDCVPCKFYTYCEQREQIAGQRLVACVTVTILSVLLIGIIVSFVL